MEKNVKKEKSTQMEKLIYFNRKISNQMQNFICKLFPHVQRAVPVGR